MSDNLPSKPTQLPGLTGLRGVGALWVVAYHGQFGLNLPVAGTGYLGVDLFFILSGFVLSHAHPDARWDWPKYRRFLQTRFARIFPLHWACLLLLVIVITFYPPLPNATPNRFLWPDLLSSALLVQNWGFGRTAPWNVPSWSLSTEWLVSIAFPLFLTAAHRFKRHAAAVLCVVCLAAFAVFLAVTHNPVPDVAGRAGVVRTVCEFAAGCLLYRFYAFGGRASAAVSICAAGLIAAGLLVPGWAILAVFGTPVVILLAANPSSTVARALSSKVMLFLGEISFSIYLLHWSLLQVYEGFLSSTHLHGASSAICFCGFVVGIIALSAMTHRWLEIPARNCLRPSRTSNVGETARAAA